MRPELKNIQGVDTLVVNTKDAQTAVIFFHGYGANMQDLFPLWEMWHQTGFDWYFPNGLQSLPMGHYEGRSWFSIDVAGLERAMREGTPRQMESFTPPELEETLKQMENFVREVGAKYKRVILGGFSQGAMLTSHLATKSDLKISGIVLLSGSLLSEKDFPKSVKGLPYYQSHGTSDPVLDMDGARALEKKLEQLGFQGKLSVFSGGHEIPPKVISEVKDFLKNLPE